MLQLLPNGVLQDREGVQRLWTFPELLGAADSLPGEALHERAGAMRHAASWAIQQERELDTTSLRNARFWSLVRPEGIEAYAASYSLTITDTYNWRLELTADGLIYNDLSGLYLRAGQVACQLLHEFWFSGPLFPIPGFELRRGLVERIRSAFRDDAPEDAGRHFPLFEYPTQPVAVPLWEDGDERVKDYVVIRPYGIESGRWNFRDGNVYCRFTSFEFYLVHPESVRECLGDEAFYWVGDHLSRIPPEERLPLLPLAPSTASKRLYMDYGGDVEAIRRDGWDNLYRPHPGEEDVWRRELTAACLAGLETENKEKSLLQYVNVLTFLGVEGVADKLIEAGRKSDPVKRQILAFLLESRFGDTRAAELVISLLQFPDPDGYWLQFVTQYCWKHAAHPLVRQTVAIWLEGKDEGKFNRALDVLRYWHVQEFLPGISRELLTSLDWNKKQAGDPQFLKSLQEILSIVRKTD